MCKELNYIINHAFLPPKLPQKNDNDITKSAALIEKVLAALRSFQAHIPEQERSEWTSCIEMVGNMLELRGHFGGLVPEQVETKLGKMVDGGMNEPTFGDETVV